MEKSLINALCDIILSEFYETKDIDKLREEKVQYLPNRYKEVGKAFCTNNIADDLLKYEDNHSLMIGIKKTIG